jgi:hypothetical protein
MAGKVVGRHLLIEFLVLEEVVHVGVVLLGRPYFVSMYSSLDNLFFA